MVKEVIGMSVGKLDRVSVITATYGGTMQQSNAAVRPELLCSASEAAGAPVPGEHLVWCGTATETSGRRWRRRS